MCVNEERPPSANSLYYNTTCTTNFYEMKWNA